MPNDHPLAKILAAVQEKAAKGWLCYQKFTCANCGERLTMDTPNVLHTTGHCDKCGHVTDIEKQGCNYLATISLQNPPKVAR